MSVAKAVTPHLPYLRRFARALSGSQERGDSHVVALLKALIANPATFERNLPTRTSLIKSFLKVWDSIEAEDAHCTNDSNEITDRRIGSLTPKSRQAFLLATLEGFSTSEVALALGVSENDAEALLRQAGAEIARQMAVDVLIIEDEPLIALDLETLVQQLGHRVHGIARTRKEAVAAVGRKPPGLVLADIHLADGSSGLEAVLDILASTNVPVIFITAFPQSLLTGAKPEPAFLITKPFQPDAVKAIISQALFFDMKAATTRN